MTNSQNLGTIEATKDVYKRQAIYSRGLFQNDWR